MPNAFSDVNFIPDEVVSDRKHISQVKGLNKMAVAAMIVSLIIGGGLLGYNLYTKNKITSLEDENKTQEAQIQQLNEFAKDGYKLGLRLASVKKILDARPYYGKTIEELYGQIPNGVSIDNLQIDNDGSAVLTGSATPNYIPIALFQDNLKNSTKGYFKDISLKTASLNKTDGNVNFTLEFTIDLTKTYESI